MFSYFIMIPTGNKKKNRKWVKWGGNILLLFYPLSPFSPVSILAFLFFLKELLLCDVSYIELFTRKI